MEEKKGLDIEKLMLPRYKVIADYPKTKFKIGEIILFIDNPQINYLDKYPAIFKRLQWWEEREEKDMPEYVGYKFMEYSIEQILKVPKHFINSLGEYNKYIFCINEVPHSYSKCRIATKEEYETQNKKQ